MKTPALLIAFLFFVAMSPPSAFAQVSSTNSPAPPSAGSVWLKQLGSRGVRVHDPSTIVKCKDEYWVFYTGRGVPSYHSKDFTNWEAGPYVFTNTPAWVAQTVPQDPRAFRFRSGSSSNFLRSFWAPDVIQVSNRWLLYYSVSVFGKKTSAIGLVTNPTLDPADPAYLWTDCGPVVQSNTNNDFNTIDPAVSLDTEGRLWLAFGSYWTGIKLIQLDAATGKRIAPDSPMYPLARHDSIEASYIHPHDGYYYLFVDWGTCCRGTNSTYEIRTGRSKLITGPYLDQRGTDMFQNGGTLFLKSTGPFIGPGHAGIISAGAHDWFSCHFYDGTRQGMSALAILPLRWDADGWPEVEVPAIK